jgi:16S rRNA G966 N2-methylase RsmD
MESVLIKGDALKYIKACHRQFDIIFADPPYALPELPSIPELILSSDMLAEGGLLVFEHGKNNDFSQHPRFINHREYGSVNFSLFR